MPEPNPYEPPKTVDEPSKKRPMPFWKRFAPLLGSISGGCLMPVLLMILFAALGDMGGPLIYPLAAIPLAILGALVGWIIRVV